eukprot:scaffold421239_cov42-Attheya_sp.AAC.3
MSQVFNDPSPSCEASKPIPVPTPNSSNYNTSPSSDIDTSPHLSAIDYEERTYYDLATWKMYERITAARKQAFIASVQADNTRTTNRSMLVFTQTPFKLDIRAKYDNRQHSSGYKYETGVETTTDLNWIPQDEYKREEAENLTDSSSECEVFTLDL